MAKKAILTFHEKFKQYDLGEGHPFRGDRFPKVIKFFMEQGLFKLPQVTLVKPSPASREDLLRVHSENYVNLIFRLAKENKPYDIETPVSPEILEAVILIVGGAITCGKTVLDGKAEIGISIGGGFHHAGKNYGGGFCLFNDVAILVEYLRTKYNLKRFLILDHDVHFGNGTSDIYYNDPTVLYISLHQDPHTLYPGIGFTWQIGSGDGEGCNVNVPLPPGTSDETYLYALNEIFVPLAEEFKPEILITNGGSDPHFADQLGGLSLTAKGFFKLSNTVRVVAEKVCNGKFVTMICSGYNPEVLPICWYALTAGAIGLDFNIKEPYKPPEEPRGCRKIVEATIQELKKLLKKKWGCFR